MSGSFARSESASSSSYIVSKRRLSSSSSEISTKRWILYARSIDKWIAENNKELETTTWLKYDIVNREQVDCLKCCKVQRSAGGDEELQLSVY